jgi:hypothetical protein
VYRPMWDLPPRFSVNEYSPLNVVGLDHSLRGSFLQQLKYERFLKAVLEDHSTILCTILKAILGAWLEVVGSLDLDARLESEDVEFQDNNRFLWHLMDRHHLRQQNFRMIKHLVTIVESQGCQTFRTKPGTQAYEAMKSLKVDLTDILSRTQYQSSMIERRVTNLAALRSIHESQKAIEQSDYIG